MKKVYLLLSALILTTLSFAQAPQGMNYQGVARDFTGAAISKTAISVQFTMRSGSTSGSIDRKSTRLNSSHIQKSRMPSSA